MGVEGGDRRRLFTLPNSLGKKVGPFPYITREGKGGGDDAYCFLLDRL